MSLFSSDDALHDAATRLHANGFKLSPEEAPSLDAIVASMSSQPKLNAPKLACWARTFRELSLITPPPNEALTKDLFGKALPLFCRAWVAALAVAKEKGSLQTSGVAAAQHANIAEDVFNAIHSFSQRSGPTSFYEALGLVADHGQLADHAAAPALWGTVAGAFYHLPRCYSEARGDEDVPASSLSWLASKQIFAWLAAVARGSNNGALKVMSELMDSSSVCRRVVRDSPRLLHDVTRHAIDHWGENQMAMTVVADMLDNATSEDGILSPGQVVEILGTSILTPLSQVRTVMR